MLGLPEPRAYDPFAELSLDNAASLDFMDSEREIHGQHGHWLEIITRPYGSGG